MSPILHPTYGLRTSFEHTYTIPFLAEHATHSPSTTSFNFSLLLPFASNHQQKLLSTIAALLEQPWSLYLSLIPAHFQVFNKEETTQMNENTNSHITLGNVNVPTFK